MARKLWTVKCPMCGKTWKYRNDHITVQPKYIYCRKCEKAQGDIGKAALRPLHYHVDGEE